jgi:hypothetical protein
MIYFIIIYVVSFLLSYLVIRWTFKTVWTNGNPGLKDLLIVILPFVNTVAFIMVFIYTLKELNNKKSFTTNKFFNIKKRP